MRFASGRISRPMTLEVLHDLRQLEKLVIVVVEASEWQP